MTDASRPSRRRDCWLCTSTVRSGRFRRGRSGCGPGSGGPCSCTTSGGSLWSRVDKRRLTTTTRLALCHGHSSSISVHEWNVSLPRASAYDPPSYRSFILLCELTMLLDEALSTLCSVRIYESDRRRPDWKLAAVADLGRKLDASRAQMDQLDGAVRLSLRSGDVMPAGFRPSSSPRCVEGADEGIDSLRLSFHAVAMLLSRTALDSVTGNDSVATSAVVSAQQGVLQVAEDVVEFVCCLTGLDFAGYWSVCTSRPSSHTERRLIRLKTARRTCPRP